MRKILKYVACTVAAVLALALMGQAAAQDIASPVVVTTDKTGYLAGETITISGSGFGPNEAVTVKISRAGGKANPAAWDVWTDLAGAFTATWSINPLDVAGNQFLVTASAASGSAAEAAFRRIAAIRADKFDYKAGETAQIVGAGFRPFEQVTLQVSHISGLRGGSGHDPVLLTSDGNGQICYDWFVDPDDSQGAFVVVKAGGAESGVQGLTLFMDAPVTIPDDNGPDDLPGQKDLNQLTTDRANLPTSLEISWNWDDTAWSGQNTGDVCALFDTDGDGKANFALCVTVGGDPAAILQNSDCTKANKPYQCCTDAGQGICGTKLWSCGDAKSDRCTQQTNLVSPFSSTCTAALSGNSDPFRFISSHVTGSTCGATPGCYTDDTVAACTANLSDFGAGSAFLINVCSYPSQQPNSDPSDCVVTPDNGFLTICKVADPNDSTQFTFNLGAGQQSQNGHSNWTVTGSQCVDLISFAPGTAYDLNESVPDGWRLDSASCVIQTSPTTTPTGTPDAPPAQTGPVSKGVQNFEVRTGLETICTFHDELCWTGKCDDEIDCTVDTCDPGTGECTHTPDDTACHDTNPCTTDSCNPATGCVFTNNTNSCDDATVCNGHEVCGGGSCNPGTPLVVDDGNVCTDDSCDPVTGVQHVNNTNSCNDGNACTTGDVCSGGVCAGTDTSAVDCNDNNVCTNDFCDPVSGCYYQGVGVLTLCDDGDKCTGTVSEPDTCGGSQCNPGGPVNCDDGKACTDDSCNPASGCVNTPDDTNVCTDGNACTTADACVSGECVGGPPPNCDDGNICTDDTCDPTAAQSLVFNGDFEQGPDLGGDPFKNLLSGNTTITGWTVGGAGIDYIGDYWTAPPGSTRSIDLTGEGAGSLTTTLTTIPGHIYRVFFDMAGNLVLDPPVKAMVVSATADSTTLATATYTFDTSNPPNPPNSAWTLNNMGWVTHTFDFTATSASTTLTFTSLTAGNCGPALDNVRAFEESADACVHTNNTASCDDGQFCTKDDACSNGECAGTPYLPPGCDDTNVCTDNACDAAANEGHGACKITNNTAPCDDGTVCNGHEVCGGGTCNAGTPLNCNDGNVCTTDSCNDQTGCVNKPVDEGGLSCSAVTDSSLCPLPDPFNLNYKGTKTKNVYELNASNPGQFYYNVFYNGTPNQQVTLTIKIPYPFVTQGANPIQVHNSAGPSGVTYNSCFAAGGSLSGYTITTNGHVWKATETPVIVLADYGKTPIVGTTFMTVTVKGLVPGTGLLYVTLHLDYGFKQTTGWAKSGSSPSFTATNPGGPAPNPIPTPVTIITPQPYKFSFANGGTGDTRIARSRNQF